MRVDPEAVIHLVQQICPYSAVQGDLMRLLEAALEAGDNCFFQIGQGLTRDGKAHLFHQFEGESCSFPISRAGARQLGMEDLTLDCYRTPSRTREAIRPMVTLGNVRISPVPRQGTFRMTMKVLDVRWPDETDAVRPYRILMEVHSSGPQVSGWICPPARLLKGRKFTFTLDSTMLRDEKHLISGPTGVFVSVCREPDPVRRSRDRNELRLTQLSNLVGVRVAF